MAKDDDACDAGEANVLVYTMWGEWAQCNVCGKANGERRRTGL